MWQSRQLLELMKEGRRRTKEGGKSFKEHARVRQIVNFVMIVCPFSSGDISREGREEGLIHIKVSRIFWFAPHPFSSPEFRTMTTGIQQRSSALSLKPKLYFTFYTYTSCVIRTVRVPPDFCNRAYFVRSGRTCTLKLFCSNQFFHMEESQCDIKQK